MVSCQVIEAIVAKKFRGCDISSKNHIFTCGIACFFNGFTDHFHGCFIGGKVWCITAFVTYGSGQSLLLQHIFQGMIDFSAHAQTFVEAGNTDRHNHAFLDVHIVVCMSTTVHDIHHRYRQVMGIHTAQILVQRKAGRSSCCMSSSQGYTQNGIGPKAALVFRTVKIDEDVVKASLVAGIPAEHGISDFAVYIVYRLQDSFTVVPAFVAISKFSSLKHAGRCTGGNGGPGKGAVFQCHFYFYCGISPGIQNFSCVQISNCCHALFLL